MSNQTKEEEDTSPSSAPSSAEISDDKDLNMCENDMMTSSYAEISFGCSDDDIDDHTDVEELAHDAKEMANKKMSLSLSLPQLSSSIVEWSEQTKASYETDLESHPHGQGIASSSRLDETKEGNEDEEGPMVSFVAQDFEEKLKLSGSLSSLERETPQIDFKLLKTMENQAKMLFQNVNTMVKHISESTHNITSLTIECISTYDNCLSQTCDVVDSNIKSMYQLMAKCEELNQAMKPIDKISDQIKEVKRLLDLFEKAVDNKM